jgi:hypothetical protein
MLRAELQAGRLAQVLAGVALVIVVTATIFTLLRYRDSGPGAAHRSSPSGL